LAQATTFHFTSHIEHHASPFLLLLQQTLEAP